MPLTFDFQQAQQSLRRRDKTLGELMRRAGPIVLETEEFRSPFDALCRAIVYQQLSGKAAATIFGRVKGLFPARRKLHPQDILDIDPKLLRAAGMSHAKIAAIKDLAAKTLAGVVPSLAKLKQMDDAEILERLTSVRGIGPWTVEMLLIFRLGRPDVLPVSDLGVRRGYMMTYGKSEMPSVADLLAHGERWRPYRTVASWYMWRAVDLYRREAAS